MDYNEPTPYKGVHNVHQELYPKARRVRSIHDRHHRRPLADLRARSLPANPLSSKRTILTRIILFSPRINNRAYSREPPPTRRTQCLTI